MVNLTASERVHPIVEFFPSSGPFGAANWNLFVQFVRSNTAPEPQKIKSDQKHDECQHDQRGRNTAPNATDDRRDQGRERRRENDAPKWRTILLAYHAAFASVLLSNGPTKSSKLQRDLSNQAPLRAGFDGRNRNCNRVDRSHVAGIFKILRDTRDYETS